MKTYIKNLTVALALFAGCISTTNATVTVLTGNQRNAGNIVVDGSRVYWINQNTSAVSSIDKLSGGTSSVTTHFAGTGWPGGHLVQDTSFLYFTANGVLGVDASTNLPITFGVFKASKTSSSASMLEPTHGAGGFGLALSNGTLYYVSNFQTVPNSNGLVNQTIQKISTQGGTSVPLIPLTTNPWPQTGDFSTDSAYLHWADTSAANVIRRIPLIGGIISNEISAPVPGVMLTPTTGAAGGYLFWVQGNATSQILKRRSASGGIITLLTGVPNLSSLVHNFVVVGSDVYTTTLAGTIVKVPIDGLPVGGIAPIVISAVDGNSPFGLTSDGTYLYWTAAGDGTIRRSTVSTSTTKYIITANVNPSTGGTAGGSGTYAGGATATVSALANTGYTFKNWTENGVIVSSALSYSFAATADRTLTANFTPVTSTYTIAVSANPSSGGTVNGGGTFSNGATATVNAIPNSGYFFVNWTESGTVVSASSAYTFTVSKSRTLVANFATGYTISVSANPTVGGTVSGGGHYSLNTSATVTASAGSNYAFSNWTDNGTIVSSSSSYTFTVTKNRTLVANFAATITYTISVSANPTAGGTVSGGGTYGSGVTPTVKATANSGYTFANWTQNGTVVSTSSSYSFTVNANRILVANFTTTASYTVSLGVSPTGSGTVSGGGTYPSGATVTVIANPVSGYFFKNWTENGGVVSTASSYVFSLTKSRSLIANFSTSSSSLANLTPYKVSGWSDKIVVSTVTGTTTDALYLSPINNLYIDWAVVNNGTLATGVTFNTQLYIDNVLKITWSSAPPININYYVAVHDYNIGVLPTGTHTIKIVTDSSGVVAETNEADNTYIKTIVVGPNRTDFNSDGKSDYLLTNTVGKTQISYLNGATLSSTVSGPTVTTGWQLVSQNDVNGDNKADFVLFNPSTRQSQIWYLNNASVASSVAGPTLPSGWALKATADFNKDGKADYLLFNPTTLATFVWYMNGATYVSGVGGPSLTSGWTIVCANDFNGDGKSDYLLVDTAGNTKIWTITLLNGTSSTLTSAAGPVIPSGWKLLSGLGDYNADKKRDWVIVNPSTLATQIWYMSGTTKLGNAAGPTLPVGFSVFGR
jgi:hypothetical protein